MVPKSSISRSKRIHTFWGPWFLFSGGFTDRLCEAWVLSAFEKNFSPQEQGFSFLYLYCKSVSAYLLYSCVYCIIKLIQETKYVILCTYLNLTQLILKAAGTRCIFLHWESFCAGYYSVILHYSLKSQTKAIIFFRRFFIFVALTSEPVLWRVSDPGLHFRTMRSAKGMRERLMDRTPDWKSDALGSIPSSICGCIS